MPKQLVLQESIQKVEYHDSQHIELTHYHCLIRSWMFVSIWDLWDKWWSVPIPQSKYFQRNVIFVLGLCHLQYLIITGMHIQRGWVWEILSCAVCVVRALSFRGETWRVMANRESWDHSLQCLVQGLEAGTFLVDLGLINANYNHQALPAHLPSIYLMSLQVTTWKRGYLFYSTTISIFPVVDMCMHEPS